jgi:hypothetical protein
MKPQSGLRNPSHAGLCSAVMSNSERCGVTGGGRGCNEGRAFDLSPELDPSVSFTRAKRWIAMAEEGAPRAHGLVRAAATEVQVRETTHGVRPATSSSLRRAASGLRSASTTAVASRVTHRARGTHRAWFSTCPTASSRHLCQTIRCMALASDVLRSSFIVVLFHGAVCCPRQQTRPTRHCVGERIRLEHH